MPFYQILENYRKNENKNELLTSTNLLSVLVKKVYFLKEVNRKLS